MSTHIKKLRNTTFFCLYDIRRMRKYLDKKSLLTLVHAFITSRLDYCNSLLYGLPNTAILQLDSLPFHISSAMLPLHSVISVRYQSVYQLRSWEDVDIFRRQIFFCCCSTLWNALPTSLMKSKQFNTLTPYSKQIFLNKHLILSIFNFIFFENFIRF